MTVSETELTVTEGEEVRIQCLGEGVGVVRIRWYHGNEESVLQIGNDLVIPSVASTHTGQYECRVSNIAGAVTETVQITVKCELLHTSNVYMYMYAMKRSPMQCYTVFSLRSQHVLNIVILSLSLSHTHPSYRYAVQHDPVQECVFHVQANHFPHLLGVDYCSRLHVYL